MHQVQHSVGILNLRKTNGQLLDGRVTFEKLEQVRVVGHLEDLDSVRFVEALEKVARQGLSISEQGNTWNGHHDLGGKSERIGQERSRGS